MVWLPHTLKVKQFFEMFKNAENGHILQAVNSLFLGHFFQTATIQRPIVIMTWNQLSLTLFSLNFHVVKAAFWYLTPFWTNSILKNGLILNIFSALRKRWLSSLFRSLRMCVASEVFSFHPRNISRKGCPLVLRI